MSGVYFRGKGKSRAQLLKEELEQREKTQLLEGFIDLYPTEDDTYINYRDNHYIKKMMQESEMKKSFRNISAFQEDVLKELFFQTIFTNTIEPVLTESYANDRQKEIAARTVIDYINEQDTYELLNKWKYKNLYLAEYAQNIDRVYHLITETAKDKIREGLSQQDAFKIENEKIDDFIVDTKDVVPADISKTITNRVEDAINDFIADNKLNKEKIMRIYDKAKDKIAAAEGDVEVQESAMRMAKRQEKIITESDTNVFGAMTKIMVESVMKIPVLQESYSDNVGKIDFSKVIGDVRSIYTCLEAMNTLGMIDANSTYIDKTLNDMRESMEQSTSSSTNNLNISNDDKMTDTGDSKQPKEKFQGNGTKNDNDPSTDFE